MQFTKDDVRSGGEEREKGCLRIVSGKNLLGWRLSTAIIPRAPTCVTPLQTPRSHPTYPRTFVPTTLIACYIIRYLTPRRDPLVWVLAETAWSLYIHQPSVYLPFLKIRCLPVCNNGMGRCHGTSPSETTLKNTLLRPELLYTLHILLPPKKGLREMHFFRKLLHLFEGKEEFHPFALVSSWSYI